MLAVTGLEVNYGQASALRGVNLEVRRGEVVAVIGRNGAGKTTLLRAITGLQPAAAGQIRFKDQDITGRPAYAIVRLGIGHVPQGRQVFGDQSVEDNLILGAYTDRPRARERMAAMYRLFPRLQERRRQQAGTLSGGEQQMLAIARALMAGPELLVMDEPSMGLAPLFVKQVFETVLQLKDQGKTILLVEQMAQAALAISDRAYILQTGQVHHQGPSRALLQDNRVLRAYLGA